MSLSKRIDVSNIRTREVVIVAPRAEYDPSAVGRPCVVTLGIARVGGNKRIGIIGWKLALIRLCEVLHPKVGTLVIEVELSVFGKCVAEITTIGCDARHTTTEPHRTGIHFEARFTEGVRDSIERHGVDVIKKFVIAHHKTCFEISVLELWQSCTTIVHSSAVGRPAGEGLEIVGGAKDVTDNIVFDIIEK